MTFSPVPKGWRWTPHSFCQTAGSMAGMRGVETQHKELRELLHGGIRVDVVVDGIALRPPGLGAEVGRQLLVAYLGGAFFRRIGGWLFSLALTAVGGSIRLVVGVGIVVVLHKPHNCDSQPRNPPTLDLTPTREHPVLHGCRAAA